MKVLNRPMFRMGGPIKEGIMSGIKEPRRGYNQGNMVFPANVNTMLPTGINVENAAKKFENIFDVNNMRPVPMMPKDNILKPISIEEKMKPYERAKNVNFAVTDYFEEDMNTTDKKIPKNTRYGVVMVDNPDYGKVKRVDKAIQAADAEGPVGIEGKNLNVDEVIEKKGKLPGDDDPPPATRKEKINSILEGLGYDRAQKNALYDAMIKAGQRISRTGLGAENLVSDVIAETSQSYDKPEKLREAANLMQVQQDLKLDQIEASKTGGAMAQNYQYFIDRGYSPEAAQRKAEGLATNLLEAKNKAIDAKLTGNKLTEYVAQQLIGIKDAYDNNTYKGTINSKEHKTVSDFARSKDFDGAGVYTVKGRIIELDENGKIVKEEIVTSSTSDKKWWNFGKEE